MKKIKLTQGKFVLVDNNLFQRLKKHKWYALRGGRTFYAVRKTPMKNGKRFLLLMHRVILGEKLGFVTDHIDGNGLNNQRNNLRHATIQQNGFNRKKTVGTSSRYLGVKWNKKDNNWSAQIRKDQKLLHLGVFKKEIEAARAYLFAKERFHTLG